MSRRVRMVLRRLADLLVPFLAAFAAAPHGLWWSICAAVVTGLYSAWSFYDGFVTALE